MVQALRLQAPPFAMTLHPAHSDIDLRIEFNNHAADDYADNYFALHDALVATLGRKVDIISSRTIRNPFFRKEIEETQVTLYAA